MKKVAVVGSGFSGLAAACVLAHAGYAVTVFEKNATAGGRARRFTSGDFVFDMGPTWYWMPDVFERFFSAFGKTCSDYYDLVRLDPSYRIYFGKDDPIDVPAQHDQLRALFELLEPGSSHALGRFIAEAKVKYELGMRNLVYHASIPFTELMKPGLLRHVPKLHLFGSFSRHIRRFFREPRLISLLEFPVLFLGTAPERTPAVYSLMNYADMALGTWYPRGGMFQVIDGMMKLAVEAGVRFRFDAPVDGVHVCGHRASAVLVKDKLEETDFLVASADYHHVEQQLLPDQFRQYTARYWNSRVLSPSALIFYLGLNKRIKGLVHHTLFFDTDFLAHARELFECPRWPTAPQFYVNCPSFTDRTVCAAGHENLMILIPVAAGLKDDEVVRERCFDAVISRMESLLNVNIRDHVIFKRSYAQRDFASDYNAFKGNAYGLANTLFQTANLKPRVVSTRVKNLFYTGHLTVPGPGVPPSIISGQIAARELMKRNRDHHNE